MRNIPDINSGLHMHTSMYVHTHSLSHKHMYIYVHTHTKYTCICKKRDRDGKWPCPTRYRSHSLTGPICMLKLKTSQLTQFLHHQVLFPPEQAQAYSSLT